MSPDESPASAPAAAPWPRGHRVGSFELVEALPAGDTGFVYRAWDHALARPVAVKEYLPAALARRDADGTVHPATPAATDAFERGRAALVDAWRTLARCDHPALVRMLHLLEAHGTVYGVMPWHDGQPLSERRLDGGQPLDEPAVRALLDELLGGIEAYHRAGQVHGGIAASKLLRLTDGRTVLLGPGAPVRPSGRNGGQGGADSAPLGPWTDLQALAATVGSLGSPRHSARYGAELRYALDAAQSPDIAKRPQSVAQFRAWLAGAVPRPATAPVFAAAPAADDDPPEADTVDPQTAAVIRRVLDSIPDAVERPHRPLRPPEPALAPPTQMPPAPPIQMPPLQPLGAVMGDDAPPFSPTSRLARGPVRRRHWGVWLGFALIAATGAAMVIWQLEQPRTTAVSAGSVSDLPTTAPTPAAAPASAAAAPPPVSPAPQAVAAAPAPAPAPTPAAASPERAVPTVVVTPPAAVAPNTAGPRAQATRPPPTPSAKRTARARAAATSPRELCSGRSGFSLYRCMQQQCRLDKWRPHAQCVRLRATDSVD